jgi:hypothetical protein
MPKKYEAIRDACIKKAERPTKKKVSQCKAKAARIYNAGRKKGQKPVTRGTK